MCRAHHNHGENEVWHAAPLQGGDTWRWHIQRGRTWYGWNRKGCWRGWNWGFGLNMRYGCWLSGFYVKACTFQEKCKIWEISKNEIIFIHFYNYYKIIFVSLQCQNATVHIWRNKVFKIFRGKNMYELPLWQQRFTPQEKTTKKPFEKRFVNVWLLNGNCIGDMQFTTFWETFSLFLLPSYKSGNL